MPEQRKPKQVVTDLRRQAGQQLFVPPVMALEAAQVIEDLETEVEFLKEFSWDASKRAGYATAGEVPNAGS